MTSRIKQKDNGGGTRMRDLAPFINSNSSLNLFSITYVIRMIKYLFVTV